MSTLCEETPQVEDVPDLIPARMLNEFSYCPRLAYLEWVQGEFADNLDTREGRFDHRRVDRPDRQERPAPDNDADAATRGDAERGDNGDSPPPADTVHSRSLMLSAPGEGLIAKMDLVDLQAGIAVPVDYKHGRVPDVPGHAWEPEQVQLCAQRADPARERLPLRRRHPVLRRFPQTRLHPLRGAAGRPHAGIAPGTPRHRRAGSHPAAVGR